MYKSVTTVYGVTRQNRVSFGQHEDRCKCRASETLSKFRITRKGRGRSMSSLLYRQACSGQTSWKFSGELPCLFNMRFCRKPECDSLKDVNDRILLKWYLKGIPYEYVNWFHFAVE